MGWDGFRARPWLLLWASNASSNIQWSKETQDITYMCKGCDTRAASKDGSRRNEVFISLLMFSWKQPGKPLSMSIFGEFSENRVPENVMHVNLSKHQLVSNPICSVHSPEFRTDFSCNRVTKVSTCNIQQCTKQCEQNQRHRPIQSLLWHCEAKWEVPYMENPIKILLKWMMLRGTPILGFPPNNCAGWRNPQGFGSRVAGWLWDASGSYLWNERIGEVQDIATPSKKKLLSCFPIFEHPLSNMLSDRNNSCRGNSVFCRGLDHISAFWFCLQIG